MTKEIISKCFIHSNGNVSFHTILYPIDDGSNKVEQIIIKDGIITTEAVNMPATGTVFTVESELVPLFFEAIGKYCGYNLHKFLNAFYKYKTDGLPDGLESVPV